MTQSKVLVTGATGFLGRRTVQMLAEQGFFVRALVRNKSRPGSLQRPGVEICNGDVTDPGSLQPAFEGIDYVVHAAADTSGSEEGARRVTILGTRNILDLCISYQVQKLVYISSCSVYGPAAYKEGQVVDESASLERFPRKRGNYSRAKLEAEKLVLEAMDRGRVAAVSLRPGTIYGPGGNNYWPMMGFSLGGRVFVLIRKDEFILPLVYVDNLAEAVISAMTSEKSRGQVYNVVDRQLVNKRQYMEGLMRRLHPGAWFFTVPYGLLLVMAGLQEPVFKAFGRRPVLSRYRLVSSQQPIVIDSSKIMRDLGWRPSVSFKEACGRIIGSNRSSSSF